jgi:bis(5'-nucleosyl)-tetraphosphatase (symmetrical)
MTTYVIGDVQGCYHSLMHLLEAVKFNSSKDKLWFVGDVINRGAGSLEVLRWLYAHQGQVQMVLGNHDLHTLVVAEGFVKAHRSDTLDALINAPDAKLLINWLRAQPLAHMEHGFLMVHAGLLPQWTAQHAMRLAQEVETALQAKNYRDFLANMYGNTPDSWHDDLQGWDRLRVITNAMTRLRICSEQGVMEFKFKGTLKQLPNDLMPWFKIPQRASRDTPIVFGHWSALGLMQDANVFSLDTGCLWNGNLTALRLEDRSIFQVPCSQQDQPIALDLSD